VKNLKGTDHPLLYYRMQPTGNRIPRTRKRKGEIEHYFEEELEKVYFDQEKVENFSLDALGRSLPTYEGNVVWLHHYMLDFWGHFIHTEGVSLYALLRRYCWDKDYCWPDQESLMLKTGIKSKVTLNKYLDLLEHYGFIYRFWVQNPNKNNMYESPIYKIRRQILLLPEELVQLLPPRLQEEHDRFIENLMRKLMITLELEEQLPHEDFYAEFMGQGEVRQTKYKREKLEEIKRRKEQLLEEQTEEDIRVQSDVLQKLSRVVSKPAFDTWFSDVIFIKNQGIYYIYVPWSMAKDWIQKRYANLLYDIIAEVTGTHYLIKVESLTTH
jgi:hypothetical protein